MEYIRAHALQWKMTLEEILNFISFYWYKNIWEESISFNDVIEFKSKTTLDFFNTLLWLHLESAIKLEIKGQLKSEMGTLNKDLDNHLSHYRYKNNWILGLFYKDGHYNIALLHKDWHTVSKSIKWLDAISYDIVIPRYLFFVLLFSKITEYLWYKNIDRVSFSKNLYKNILEETGWKSSFLWEITLFYNFFDDYIENYRLLIPVLVELEKKKKLYISKVMIKDNYIYIGINKLSDLSEEVLVQASTLIKDNWKWEKWIIQSIEYTKDWVKINSNLWTPKGSAKSEAFLLFVSNYFVENPNKNEVTITDFIDFYEENMDTLLPDIKESKRLKYLILKEDNFRTWYCSTVTEKVLKDYNQDFLEIKRWLIIKKKIEKASS